MCASSSDERHLPNRFPPFSNETAKEFFDLSSLSSASTSAVRLSNGFHDRLVETFNELFAQWEREIGAQRTDDTSVYTGVGGYVVLYHRAFKVLQKAELLDKARKIVDSISVGRLQHKDRLAFLCGDGGAVALKAVISYIQKDDRQRNECIATLLDYKDSVVQSRSIPDELLYGRAGYLYCLQFVRTHCGASSSIDAAIEDVKNRIIESGESANGSFPLSYAWHDKEYLGAAHGWAGILFQLMRTPNFDKDAKSKELVKATLDGLLKLAFRSGNFPSSIGNESDRLVHWCHGAPGFIHTLLQAHKTFGDERYLQAAKRCADVIWNRGLLKKGYGLCHGVAGNAYALISVWKATGEVAYLYQACQVQL
uniref:LanC-like protein 2 n=1 Tax=Plectus sambesii TaxID=2011161 RepID=A0A914UL35_9BILA